MTDSLERIGHKLRTAGDLQTVVRVMKAHAAAAVVPYQKAVAALEGYQAAIALGLGACLRAEPKLAAFGRQGGGGRGTAVIAFGTDRGLVGPLNDGLADFLVAQAAPWPAPVVIWVVGERLYDRLVVAGLAPRPPVTVPESPEGITPLITALLTAIEAAPGYPFGAIQVVHHRPLGAARVEPRVAQLVPLDEAWLGALRRAPWPTRQVAEAPVGVRPTFEALVREHLFIALFRACAEAIASEHVSRLAAMLRADHNIRERLDGLRLAHHQTRQRAISDELFDIVAGVVALGDSALEAE